MSLLKKIFTALRGGAREVGENIVDANGVRIFEQEMKDAENQLAKAKHDLTEVMAKEMQASRKVKSISEDISKHEGYATQALEKGDETLALEIAQKIADFQGELNIQQQAQASFSAHVDRLKAMIKKTGKGLADMQRQLVMVKTTESVQKATVSISNSYASGSSKLLSAKESLDRIQERQSHLEDRLKANEALNDEFNNTDLDAKMKEAGIIDGGSDAADILAKIKAKSS